MGIIKTVDGLAWASVKTMQGLAVASVKTILGADSVTAGSAAPQFVAQYPSSVWNTNAQDKSLMAAVVCDHADVLIGLVCEEAYESARVLTITENGAASWGIVQQVRVADKCEIDCYSYLVPSSPATETLTCAVHQAAAGSLVFGGNILRFSASSGVGASNTAAGTTGYPSVALTTTKANSAIAVIAADFAAVTGTQTWAAETASSCAATPCTGFPGNTTQYGVALAYYADVGAIGSKTMAMTAPASQNWNIVAVEIKGPA